MKIEKASDMGFCFGVRRAIKLVERAAQERGPIQTLGPLVHNKQVVDRLAGYGIGAVTHLDELQHGIVAITSHGISPESKAMIESRDLEVIDTTCPFVHKAQAVAQRLGKAGYWVLVYGDAGHSEVRGVLGWAGTNASACLTVPQFDILPKRLGILCQTTQNQERFAEFAAQIVSSELHRFTEVRIFNTICDATRKHQAAALELAEKVDLVFVIGGQDSANTRHLAEICTNAGVTTYHIENALGIDYSWLRGHNHIGITAGASTPDEVINEVVAALHTFNKTSKQEVHNAKR